MSAEREILNIEAALTEEGAVLYELRKNADGDAVVDALGYIGNADYLRKFEQVGKIYPKEVEDGEPVHYAWDSPGAQPFYPEKEEIEILGNGPSELPEDLEPEHDPELEELEAKLESGFNDEPLEIQD